MAGLNEDQGCPPPPLACPLPHVLFPLAAVPPLGAHLKGAQLGCELAQGILEEERLGGLGAGEQEVCFPWPSGRQMQTLLTPTPPPPLPPVPNIQSFPFAFICSGDG